MSGIVDETRRRHKEWSDAELVQEARDNHIWMSAMSLVNPSDDLLREVGRSVVRRLLESEMCDDLSGSFPMTYIQVNAS
jgi:hypothetical protein